VFHDVVQRNETEDVERTWIRDSIIGCIEVDNRGFPAESAQELMHAIAEGSLTGSGRSDDQLGFRKASNNVDTCAYFGIVHKPVQSLDDQSIDRRLSAN